MTGLRSVIDKEKVFWWSLVVLVHDTQNVQWQLFRSDVLPEHDLLFCFIVNKHTFAEGSVSLPISSLVL